MAGVTEDKDSLTKPTTDMVEEPVDFLGASVSSLVNFTIRHVILVVICLLLLLLLCSLFQKSKLLFIISSISIGRLIVKLIVKYSDRITQNFVIKKLSDFYKNYHDYSVGHFNVVIL